LWIIRAHGYIVISNRNCTTIRIAAQTPKVTIGMILELRVVRNAIAVVIVVILIAFTDLLYV